MKKASEVICRGCGAWNVTADHESNGRPGHTVQAACYSCGGSGTAGYVTAGMAHDGGVPDAEGQARPCSACDGAGWQAESCGPIERAASASRRS